MKRLLCLLVFLVCAVRGSAVTNAVHRAVGGRPRDGSDIVVPGPPDFSGLISGLQGVFVGCVGLGLLILGVIAGIHYVRRGLSIVNREELEDRGDLPDWAVEGECEDEMWFSE